MSPRAKLTFFRVMAFLVGIFLLILATHMVLRYGFDNDVLAWWPAPHGWFYMIYIVATALLGFELRWGMGKMVGVMLAGCVPFLSFWVEHKVSAQAKAQIEAHEEQQRSAGKVSA